MTHTVYSMSPSARRRLSVGGAVLLAIFAAGACDSSSADSGVSECIKTVGGVEYFVGSLDCLESLPQEPISGYWQVGHEYSVFYPERPAELFELDPDAAWLSFSKEAEREVMRYLADGEVHLLEVDFIGAKSDRLGLYGSTPSKKGVFMGRLVRAVEVKNVRLRRGMPPDTSLERARER